MKFFTDKTVINDYLLIKIGDYRKVKDFSRWKEIFIDPGVYELTKSNEYSWVDDLNIWEFLNVLPPNHYFSWDYPGDMNPSHAELFLQNTWENALKYHHHPNYIVTVQFKFHNYLSFIAWFDDYNALDIVSGILGLGNLCRIHFKDQYIKHVLPYAFKNCNHNRIHVYGLALRLIPFAFKLAYHYGIELSVDNTKWTFMIYEQSEKDRNICFNLYLDKIRKKGVIFD